MQTPPNDMPRQVDLTPQPAAGVPIGRISLPALMPPDRRRRERYGNLLLLGVLVGLVLGLVVFGRERIVSEWPPAGVFYDLIGLDAMAVGAGLELNNVRFVRRQVDGQDVIIVEGEVLNRTDAPQPLPTLQAVLRGEDGQPLTDWTFRVDQTELQPGEAASFRTMTRNPPEASRRLSITFVEGEG